MKKIDLSYLEARTTAEFIEELVHIRGIMTWDDLTQGEKENLLDRGNQENLLGYDEPLDYSENKVYREKLIDEINDMIIYTHERVYPNSSKDSFYGDSISSDRRDFAREFNAGGYHKPW